jgi:kinesin family member 2/24
MWPSNFTSSRDTDSEAQSLTFKERIRPGMVVRWSPPADFALQLPSKQNLAVILCPQQAAGENSKDFVGNKVQEQSDSQRYLCAMVLPGALPNAYEVSLWRQVVIDVDYMEAEVLLQYDTSTRYYHTTV